MGVFVSEKKITFASDGNLTTTFSSDKPVYEIVSKLILSSL